MKRMTVRQAHPIGAGNANFSLRYKATIAAMATCTLGKADMPEPGAWVSFRYRFQRASYIRPMSDALIWLVPSRSVSPA